MNNITIAFPYYKQPNMLNYHWQFWRQYPEAVKVHIVDDGSQKGLRAEEVITERINAGDCLQCWLRVDRILVDLPWNDCQARNLAANGSHSDVILFADIDHIVTPAVVNALLNRTFNHNTVYTFKRVTHATGATESPHKESCFMSVGLYWEIGGLDESFAGHYAFAYRDWLKRRNEHPHYQLDLRLERVRETDIPDAKTTGLVRKEGRDEEAYDQILAWKATCRNKLEKFKLPWKLVFDSHTMAP